MNDEATDGDIPAFFESLGIPHLHGLEEAFAALPDRDMVAEWRRTEKRGSRDERLAFAYGRGDIVRLLMGSDFHRIVEVAWLLAQLPEPSGSRILDIGGGPGHLALWMTRCWRSATVTVMDRIASAVAQEWTGALPSSGIRFVDGDLPGNLTAVAGQQFDRVVLAYVVAQDEKENRRANLRPIFQRAMRALGPLVAKGGDLVVIDHFYPKDTKISQAIVNASTEAGFSDKGVKGWRGARKQHTAWQLRILQRG